MLDPQKVKDHYAEVERKRLEKERQVKSDLEYQETGSTRSFDQFMLEMAWKWLRTEAESYIDASIMAQSVYLLKSMYMRGEVVNNYTTRVIREHYESHGFSVEMTDCYENDPFDNTLIICEIEIRPR